MANKLKNTAIVIKIAMTKSGTDSAVIKGMKITTHGTKPAMHPMIYDVQSVFFVV
jgi:hypothetical protein